MNTNTHPDAISVEDREWKINVCRFHPKLLVESCFDKAKAKNRITPTIYWKVFFLSFFLSFQFSTSHFHHHSHPYSFSIKSFLFNTFCLMLFINSFQCVCFLPYSTLDTLENSFWYPTLYFRGEGGVSGRRKNVIYFYFLRRLKLKTGWA